MQVNRKKRVLVACGTAIATATVVAKKVEQIAKDANIPVDVSQCKASEIRGKMGTFNADLIIATTSVPDNLGVPVLNGVPFLSGVGADELEQKIIVALKE
jgi:PTS system galactitol-specific IIB component